MNILPAHRCSLAACGLLLGWVVLYPFVASALCVRGDEFLRKGDPNDAQRYYRRAMRIDPDCRRAVERFTFSSLELRSRQGLDAAIEAADAYLARHGSDTEIEEDLALVVWASGDTARAALALRAAGKRTHDARFLRLARIAEQRTAEAALQ